MTNGRDSDSRSDGVFIDADVPSLNRDQQERLWLLIRRGKKPLLIAAALMSGALVIASARGAATWSSWLIPAVALVFAGVFELIDRRLTRRPPGTVEVPTDLAELIGEIYQIRDEIVVYGPDRFTPETYDRVVDLLTEHVFQVVAASTQLLAAERAGDQATSESLRTELEFRVEAIMELYDEMDGPEGSAGPAADAIPLEAYQRESP